MALPPRLPLLRPLTSHSHSVRMLRCRSVTCCCVLRTAATEGRQTASASRSESSSYCRLHCAPGSAAMADHAGQRLKQAARQAGAARACRPAQAEIAAARSRADSRPKISTHSSSGRAKSMLERMAEPPKPQESGKRRAWPVRLLVLGGLNSHAAVTCVSPRCPTTLHCQACNCRDLQATAGAGRRGPPPAVSGRWRRDGSETTPRNPLPAPPGPHPILFQSVGTQKPVPLRDARFIRPGTTACSCRGRFPAAAAMVHGSCRECAAAPLPSLDGHWPHLQP